MSKRTVQLKLTTQKDLVKHETEARTFGELKAEIKNIKWDGMRVVERSTKNTLTLDDAILPATDFILFVVPEKVKAGNSESIIDPKTASYNQLRSHISFLNKMKGAKISMDGGVDKLRKAYQKYLNKASKAETATKTAANEDVIGTIEECRTKINESIDAIIEAAKSQATTVVEDTTEYVIKTSVDDLENELEAIKKSLKV